MPWSCSSSGESRWSCCRGCGTSRTTGSASSRSSGRRRGSVPEGRIIALDGEAGYPGRPPPRRAALRPVALAVPHPQGPPRDHPAGQDRLRLRPRRRAAAAEPDARPRRRRATTSRTPARSCSATPGSRAASRTSASAAGSGPSSAKASTPSTWPCSSSSPRTRSTAWSSRASASCEALVGWQNELKEIDGFDPVVIGGTDRDARPAAPGPPDHWSTRIGIVTVHDGPSLPPGEIIAPAVGIDRDRHALPQQLPGPRGVPPRRRPPRPAVRPADRRHLLHQPLVRHGRADPQDGRADRLRRRGRQLLRPGRPGRLRRRVPPRRARRRGRARRLGAAARAGQVRVQHLRRQHHPGADDQLRPALGHRQDRGATATTRACARSTW